MIPLPYKLGGAVLGLVVAWGLLHAWGNHREAQGRAAERQEQKDRDSAAERRHSARIQELNRGYSEELGRLQARVDDLLAHPVERTIRVPVARLCPPARDAGVPERADSVREYVDVPDPGYGRFRDWLVRFAAAGSSDGG